MVDKYTVSSVLKQVDNFDLDIDDGQEIFSKEKEPTVTFLGLTLMVLRTVIMTLMTIVREWTLTAMEMMKRWILSLSLNLKWMKVI